MGNLSTSKPAPAADYLLESEADMGQYGPIHDGKGSLGVKLFEFNKAPHPANFVVYDIPPGGSEGVHVHRAGDPEDAFDEFYYVVSGQGQMQINGRSVPVKSGDHVYTPMGVPHGIENTSSENLKVFLTYVKRPT